MKVAPAEIANNSGKNTLPPTRSTPPSPSENDDETDDETETENENENENLRRSLGDLVVYNDQGQPTVDINRLAKKRTKKYKEREKEKLSWYLPDYIFVIFNFLSLTYSTYYLINGLAIISWRNSMQIFDIENCSANQTDNIAICDEIEEQYGDEDEDMSPFTMIRFYGITDPSGYGAILTLVGVINLVNITVGINACIDGSKSLIFSYLVVDAVLMVGEVLLVMILHLTGTCDYRDIEIIHTFLQRHVDNYAKNTHDELVKKDTMELDLIQLSLTCCGVGNWTDFLPRSAWNSSGQFIVRAVVERLNLDKSDMIIPTSCCREWWVRNIYCSQEAHLWAFPTSGQFETHQFRQRISPWGCLPKMVGLCKNIVAMAGGGGMVAWGIHCFLSVIRFACGISQLARNKNITEKNQEENKRTNEDEKNKFPSLSSLFGFSSESESDEPVEIDEFMPPPPNEKNVALMKSIRNFSRMQKAMSDTHLKAWMTASRNFVQGKDDYKDNEQTNQSGPYRQKDEFDIKVGAGMSTFQGRRIVHRRI